MKRRAAPFCVDCGQPKERGKHHMAQRCNPCSKVFYSAMLGAQQVLYRAIRLGQLTKARGLVCADCGGMATDWDHRDFVMLPGWSKSRGASLEHHVASALGMQVLDALDLCPSAFVTEAA